MGARNGAACSRAACVAFVGAAVDADAAFAHVFARPTRATYRATLQCKAAPSAPSAAYVTRQKSAQGAKDAAATTAVPRAAGGGSAVR